MDLSELNFELDVNESVLALYPQLTSEWITFIDRCPSNKTMPSKWLEPHLDPLRYATLAHVKPDSKMWAVWRCSKSISLPETTQQVETQSSSSSSSSSQKCHHIRTWQARICDRVSDVGASCDVSCPYCQGKRDCCSPPWSLRLWTTHAFYQWSGRNNIVYRHPLLYQQWAADDHKEVWWKCIFSRKQQQLNRPGCTCEHIWKQPLSQKFRCSFEFCPWCFFPDVSCPCRSFSWKESTARVETKALSLKIVAVKCPKQTRYPLFGPNGCVWSTCDCKHTWFCYEYQFCESCPWCTGRLRCYHNSSIATHPYLMSEWPWPHGQGSIRPQTIPLSDKTLLIPWKSGPPLTVQQKLSWSTQCNQ